MLFANGQYVDSVEEIDAVPGGAQAIQGRHKVSWAANANTPGAVNLTTPDNKQMLSTIFGLAYYDSSSGSTVMLGQLQDCAGTISSNTLTYANAFSNLTADVVYTYRKAGLIQDIVLRQQPPAPGDYGFNPGTTFLQVITEFFNPATPIITTVTNNGVTDFSTLDFGDMKMGVGQAFLFATNAGTVGGGPVLKSWTNIDNSTFLIEQIPYTAISNLLGALHASLIKPDKGKVRRTAWLDPSKPRKLSATQPAQPVKVSKTMPKETGLVLDYELLSSDTNNCVFQGDTTYLISDLCNLTGTNILEGGTVIKYTNTTAAEIQLEVLDCETAEYRPAVFTSMNDDSVGDVISGSTGTPWGDNAGLVALNFTNGPGNLQNVRFSHLAACVSFQYYLSGVPQNGGGPLAMSDFQVVDCQKVVMTIGGTFDFFNGLVYNVGYVFGPYGGRHGGEAGGQSVTAVNLTVHHCGTFEYDLSPGTMCCTNCLFVETTNIFSDGAVSNTTYVLASDSGVFQTFGGASHYLATGSSYTNEGTTELTPAQLSDLQMKTVYPPATNMVGWLTNNYTFSPQVPRDNSGSTLAVGYHYDCVDYALGISISNATATVLPGTVLAGCGSNDGVWLYSAATFNCVGTATNPNYLVRYNTVQEQATTNWESTAWGQLFSAATSDNSAERASFRFTTWSVLAQDGLFSADNQGDNLGASYSNSFQDCQFYGGQIYTAGYPLSSINSLYQRVSTDVQSANSNPNNTFYNNLFWQGEFEYKHNEGDGGTWTSRDNLFDSTAIIVDGSSSSDVCLSNAYVTTNSGTFVPSSGDVILTNSPAYEPGTLGQYYYPANLTNLIHAGSRLASAAGLYHYTVTTDNVIEGTNIVSIGFHYVATGTNGLPLVSSTNGVPDYLADANGDGLIDDGETPWADVPIITTQPTNQTVLFGSNATFTVTATGTAPLLYQWSFDGTNIPGATGSNYTITNVQITNSGSYAVFITNVVGSQTSSNAALVLPPQITSESLAWYQGYEYIQVSPPAPPGTNWINFTIIIMSVTATNADQTAYPLSYQWTINGTNVSGQTTSSFYFIPGSSSEGGYAITVTNAAGSTNLSWGTMVSALPGMVEAWGANGSGECARPVTLTNATAIAAGDYHSVAVTDNGTVLQWGQYSDGTNFYAVGSPPSSSNLVAVAASLGHDIALTANGSVTNWGLTNDVANTLPTNLQPAKAIAAGWRHNVALLTNGAVVAWGNNTYGQTNIPSDLTNAAAATAIAAGEFHSLALRTNGTVEAWGANDGGQTNVPIGLSNVVAIAAGGRNSVALISNGMVVEWGTNDFGQTNVPPGMSNVLAIAAGSSHSLALINNGTLVAWGDNTDGQTNIPYFSTNVDVKLIAAGGDHSLAAIFSPWVQYPVDVSKDLLLIYNTNSPDSSNVCAYYLTNRPMVSNANVFGVSCITNETISPSDYTNVIAAQVQEWLTLNPTKRPQYVILFQDIPSRANNDAGLTNSDGSVAYNEGGGTGTPSVQYLLNTGCATNWHPFVTGLNMNGVGGTNDCIAYINKLAFIGLNYSPGQLIISANGAQTGGYGNTNYYTAIPQYLRKSWNILFSPATRQG